MDKLQHTHAEGNCHFPTQLLERCREVDPDFKVTFLVHDEIAFECHDENHDAIVQLMQDYMMAELEGGHVTLTVNMRIEF